MEKICVNLYGGKGLLGGKESPLEADEIYCSEAASCSYFKQGLCLKCRAFMAPEICGYGKVVRTKGYTSRAAKYYDFKRRYANDPVYNRLKYPSDCFCAVMGDKLYLYTNYVDCHKRTERDEKWRRDVDGYIIGNCGFGCNYLCLPKAEATNELLKAIFSYRPTALMGGVITAWHEKRVPQILQAMKKCAPDIYGRFVAEYPEYVFEDDYIGKAAFIETLKNGTVFSVNGNDWRISGEYVETINEIDIGLGSPFWTQGGTKSRLRIKINPKMTVKITDNGIVDDDTRFA